MKLERPRWCALALLAVLFAGSTTTRAAPPQRIVSLNVCVDQILLDLVPRERIAAVTHLATDPLTVAYPERARGLPSTTGAAEDVLAKDPDLIIAGAYTTTASVSLLQRLGRRVAVVAQPQTLDGVVALVRDLAQLVDAPQRGNEMVRTFSARLDAVRQSVRARPAHLPTAVVYQVNNFVSSAGSLIDEALSVAGFRNGAAHLALAKNGQVSLEALVAAPPDLLVLASGPTAYRSAVADNLRHPALATLAAQVQTHVLPWQLWLCGTPHIADAIEQLAALRR